MGQLCCWYETPGQLWWQNGTARDQRGWSHRMSAITIPTLNKITLVRTRNNAMCNSRHQSTEHSKTEALITAYDCSLAGANKDWDAYIHYKLSRWPEQIVNLLTEAKSAEHPIHVLIFEDMKADTVREMKKVTDFLGFSFTLEEVSTRLRAGFSQFYRNHTSEFSHFTPDQEQYIHDVVYSTSQFMRDKGLYDLYPRIDDYL